MDPPPPLKPTTNNLFKNILLLRFLSFVILISALRVTYVITTKAHSPNFCFTYPTPTTFRHHVHFYSSIFQDLIAQGFLSYPSKSLCVETLNGDDVFSLRDIGVLDSIGISKKSYPPLIFSAEAHLQPFDDNTFDFEFSAGLDGSDKPLEFAFEMGRTLKPGGFLVIHTKAKDVYSFHSLLDLFNCCTLVKSREINSLDSSITIREIVMRKEIKNPEMKSSPSKCSVPGYKREIVKNAEQLFDKEPLKPWVTLKRNMRNVKYLTSMVDTSFKRKHVYIDVGARNYGSSINSWFKKRYPKQNKTFEIYAIEADKTFHEEYKNKKGVKLLPYTAWVRNETLFFEITRDPGKKIMEKGKGMGRIQAAAAVQLSGNYLGDHVYKIQGFDFASWLKETVSETDFVVMKMDVEGAEFHLIPRLIETGAICLIDEIFLECHYNRWQRCCSRQTSVKFHKSYDQCLDLFKSLRDSGVLVHQWF